MVAVLLILVIFDMEWLFLYFFEVGCPPLFPKEREEGRPGGGGVIQETEASEYGEQNVENLVKY